MLKNKSLHCIITAVVTCWLDFETFWGLGDMGGVRVVFVAGLGDAADDEFAA